MLSCWFLLLFVLYISMFGVLFCGAVGLADQWIQYDLGPPRQIMGVVTRGHGGWENKQRHHVSWITSYTMSYSNDTLLWFSYRDGNHLDPKVSCHAPVTPLFSLSFSRCLLPEHLVSTRSNNRALFACAGSVAGNGH